MKIKGEGALPDFVLRQMMEKSMILEADPERVSPASLDLTISDEIYRVEGLVFPNKEEKVRDVLSLCSVNAISHNLKNPLEVDVVYYVRINEQLSLPKDIYGYTNPKSTTGRGDIHVRLLTDETPRYDTVNAGYDGELWLVIIPKSFPILLFKNQDLIQLRLFNKDTRLKEYELGNFLDSNQIIWIGDKNLKNSDIKIRDYDGSVLLTVDLSISIVGWECLGVSKILDFSKGKYFYKAEDFFRPIKRGNNNLSLRKGGFYILSSQERVVIPPGYACEMRPMDERAGEFRSHYAGFIDPGWGYGKNGKGQGRQLTLEVRPFEDIVIWHGQPVAKIRFEEVTDIPDKHYDHKNTSNYTGQKGPTLSKFFKPI